MPLTRKGHTVCYLFLALSSAVIAFVQFRVLTPVHAVPKLHQNIPQFEQC